MRQIIFTHADPVILYHKLICSISFLFRSDFLERDRHFSTFVGILDCITDDIQKNFTDFCAVTDDIVMLQICIPVDLQMFFLSLWF